MGERVSGVLRAYVSSGWPSEWFLDCDPAMGNEGLVVQWPSTWVADGFDKYLIRDAGGARMARSRDQLVLTGELTTVGGRRAIQVDRPPEVVRQAGPIEAAPAGWRGFNRSPWWPLVFGASQLFIAFSSLMRGAEVLGWIEVGFVTLLFASGLLGFLHRRIDLPMALQRVAWTSLPHDWPRR